MLGLAMLWTHAISSAAWERWDRNKADGWAGKAKEVVWFLAYLTSCALPCVFLVSGWKAGSIEVAGETTQEFGRWAILSAGQLVLVASGVIVTLSLR